MVVVSFLAQEYRLEFHSGIIKNTIVLHSS